MGSTTAAFDLKKALFAAVPLAVPAAASGAVQVAYGYPTSLKDDSVLIMGVQTAQSWQTSNRGREETLEVEVVVSAWRVSADGQHDADEAAYGVLELLDRYCRVTDPTLIGAGAPVGLIREVACTGTDSEGFTDKEWRQSGRGCEIRATFTARARIQG